MRDFVSRITLGFVMAQLFPGALLLYALSFLYFSLPPTVSPSLYQEVNVVLAAWETGSVVRNIVLLGMCAGTGMLIHGLHWAVVGALESRFGSVFDSYGHDRAIWIQVLTGPVKIIREVIDLLFRTTHIRAAGVAEKVTGIDSSRIAQFQFLEEFYLYSAQFLVNTAYAAIGCFVGLGTFIAFGGVSLRRLLLLGLVWCAAGLFFVLGRIQLETMFRAQSELAPPPAE